MEQALGEVELIERAAKGDHDAQLHMVQLCMVHHWMGSATLAEAYSAAEAFARLAATSGTIKAATALAQLLLLRADECQETNPARARVYSEEANELLAALVGTVEGRMQVAAILTTQADKGDEVASLRFNELLESLNPKEAKSLKAGVKRLLAEEQKFMDEMRELIAESVPTSN